ncbi:hypothetical protein K490DRAFT_54719 [Saccharata proteae CBS 121410]|uniref:Uncharacterized protein n=1 Tax=Saccharata proteae CBS 121410 TaxID=1314787 RepID=A0A9P4M0M1_9PEZI|nr:hypothetical protein K490DRAFT_54719 [Saccharata proteae CBS 121410]
MWALLGVMGVLGVLGVLGVRVVLASSECLRGCEGGLVVMQSVRMVHRNRIIAGRLSRKCQLSIVKCQVSSVKCQVSSGKCQVSSGKCQVSSGKCLRLLATRSPFYQCLDGHGKSVVDGSQDHQSALAVDLPRPVQTTVSSGPKLCRPPGNPSDDDTCPHLQLDTLDALQQTRENLLVSYIGTVPARRRRQNNASSASWRTYDSGNDKDESDAPAPSTQNYTPRSQRPRRSRRCSRQSPGTPANGDIEQPGPAHHGPTSVPLLSLLLSAPARSGYGVRPRETSWAPRQHREAAADSPCKDRSDAFTPLTNLEDLEHSFPHQYRRPPTPPTSYPSSPIALAICPQDDFKLPSLSPSPLPSPDAYPSSPNLNTHAQSPHQQHDEPQTLRSRESRSWLSDRASRTSDMDPSPITPMGPRLASQTFPMGHWGQVSPNTVGEKDGFERSDADGYAGSPALNTSTTRNYIYSTPSWDKSSRKALKRKDSFERSDAAVDSELAHPKTTPPQNYAQPTPLCDKNPHSTLHKRDSFQHPAAAAAAPLAPRASRSTNTPNRDPKPQHHTSPSTPPEADTSRITPRSRSRSRYLRARRNAAAAVGPIRGSRPHARARAAVDGGVRAVRRGGEDGGEGRGSSGGGVGDGGSDDGAEGQRGG